MSRMGIWPPHESNSLQLNFHNWDGNLSNLSLYSCIHTTFTGFSQFLLLPLLLLALLLLLLLLLALLPPHLAVGTLIDALANAALLSIERRQAAAAALLLEILDDVIQLQHAVQLQHSSEIEIKIKLS